MSHLRRYGKIFGYPECCIDSFCKHAPLTKDQEKVAGNLGFIPCPLHTLMILEGIVKLPDLIKNRIYPKEFPDGKGCSRWIKMNQLEMP